MSTNAFEIYWKGVRKVELNEMTLYGTEFSRNEEALKFINFAFELFYNCRQGIMRCEDKSMRDEMTSELEDAATVGSGRGVDDLREAIEHAVSAKTETGWSAFFQWYSNKTETYQCVEHDPKRFLNPYDTRTSTLWQHGSIKCAKSTVLFVAAMDEKFKELGAGAKPYANAVNKLQKVVQTNNAPDQDWRAVGSLLQETGEAADKVKKWMWLAPAQLDGFERYIGGASSFLGVANKIKTFGDNYVHYGDSVAMATLEEALGYLPVLGGFYAKALHMIPGLKGWFAEVMQYRLDQIDSATRDDRHGVNLSLPRSGVRTAMAEWRSNATQGGSRNVRPNRRA